MNVTGRLAPLLASLLLVLTFGCATTQSATTPVAGAHPLFLWRVEGHGAQAPSYLLGSVHLLGPNTPWLVPTIEHAFADTTDLVLEIDDSDMDPATMQKLVVEKGLFMGATTLSTLLGDEAWGRLKVIAKDLGVSPLALVHMRPWLAALTLSMTALEKAGIDAKLGVEKQLQAKAAAAHMGVHSLETPQEQIEVLAGFDSALGPEMVKDLVDHPDENSPDATRAHHSDMAKAWLAGDASTMQRLLAKERENPALAAFFTALLDDRNVHMADRVDSYLQHGKAFVAVGAAHMVGDQGLVALLRSRGYTVTQLSTADAR
jgi:hypothetical protein